MINYTQCQGTREYQRQGVSRDLWSCPKQDEVLAAPGVRAGGMFQSKRYFGNEHLSQRNACLQFLEALQQVMPALEGHGAHSSLCFKQPPRSTCDGSCAESEPQAAAHQDDKRADPEEQRLCAP